MLLVRIGHRNGNGSRSERGGVYSSLKFWAVRGCFEVLPRLATEVKDALVGGE